MPSLLELTLYAHLAGAMLGGAIGSLLMWGGAELMKKKDGGGYVLCLIGAVIIYFAIGWNLVPDRVVDAGRVFQMPAAVWKWIAWIMPVAAPAAYAATEFVNWLRRRGTDAVKT